MQRGGSRLWAAGATVGALAALVLSVTVAATAANGPGARTSGTVVGASRPALPAQHLVALGDSVPAGTGCACMAFPALLARDARAAAISAGRAGSLADLSTDGLTAARLAQDLAAPAPDRRAALRRATVVLVTVGANDLDEAAAVASCREAVRCSGGGIELAARRLTEVFARVRAAAPVARIVALGYWNAFPSGRLGQSRGPGYIAASEAATRSLNAAIRSAAERVGADFVDLYTVFGEDGRADDADLLADDSDHPNAAGHRLIAGAVERTLGWR